MAERYSIDGQILTDMADAIRNSRGQQPITLSLNSQLYTTQTNSFTFKLSNSLKANTRYKLTVKCQTATNGSYIFMDMNIYLNDASGLQIAEAFKITKGQTSELYFTTDVQANAIYVTKSSNEMATFAEPWVFEECDENNNIVCYYTPQQMVDAVSASLPTTENLAYTGSAPNLFYGGNHDWLIKNYGHLITTNNLSNIQYMFSESKVEEIPFEINCAPGGYMAFMYVFSNCSNLKSLPRFNNLTPDYMTSTFSYCNSLREIPDDYFDNWDWSKLDNATSGWSETGGSIFKECYSLRKLPMTWSYHANPHVDSLYNSHNNTLFNRCYSLDGIKELGVMNSPNASSNLFGSTFNHCSRLKEMTFKTGYDPLNWSNQTIDLSEYIGYVYSYNKKYILNYNSGITADKEVTDDATYQALKDDPDWFTADVAYSRYNHDSAVNTINSLPTTTGSGCLIKFKGEAGSATDGGAINTLTEEEIAVAAAKGWTVSLV